MDEQTTTTIYEPPVLVELGEFSENTLGQGSGYTDNTGFIPLPPGR